MPTSELANFFPNTGGTMAVGSYSSQGDSPYGAADMAGNVWEWTSSRPDPFPYNASDGREDPGREGKRVLRGGAWYLSEDFVRCASRFSFGANYGWSNAVPSCKRTFVSAWRQREYSARRRPACPSKED